MDVVAQLLTGDFRRIVPGHGEIVRKRSTGLVGRADRLSCCALLAECLHGGDAFAAHGPHPGHRHVEVALRQPAATDVPSEHQNPVAVILEVLWQRLDAAIGDPDPPKPSAYCPMADRGSPPFQEAQHRRPGDLRVEKRDQRLQVAFLARRDRRAALGRRCRVPCTPSFPGAPNLSRPGRGKIRFDGSQPRGFRDQAVLGGAVRLGPRRAARGWLTAGVGAAGRNCPLVVPSLAGDDSGGVSRSVVFRWYACSRLSRR